MYYLKIYLEDNIQVPFSTHCVLDMLNFGLSESEQNVYKGCTGSKFYTKFGIKNDAKGIIGMHCRLALLKVLNIKVPSTCVVGQMLFAVHLIFDCRGKWTLTFSTSDGSENMCFP